MASSGLSPSGLNLFFLEPRYWVTELWPRRWKRCLWLVQNHHSKKASVTRIHIQHIDLQLNNTFHTVSTESAGLHTVWSQSRRQGTTCNAKTLQKNKSLWSQWLLHHICPNNTTRLHKTCIWKKERTKKKKKKNCPVINSTLSKCVPHVNKTPECAEDGQHTCVVFHQLL